MANPTWKCETCAYFAPKDATLGECRKEAPALSPLLQLHPDFPPSYQWPRVRKDDWCGEWVAKT